MALCGLNGTIWGEGLAMGQGANELDFTGEGVFYGRVSPLNAVKTAPKCPCPHVTGKETAVQGGDAASPGGNLGLCDCGGALSLPGLHGQRSLVWPQPQHLLGPFVKWEPEFPPCQLLRGLNQLMGIKCASTTSKVGHCDSGGRRWGLDQ